MNIIKMLLDINPFSRPGTKIGKITAAACHYVGNPGSKAINNRNYFNNLKSQTATPKTSASSHYIVGLDGEVIQCIPEDEISYCTNSANSYTISIEGCHPDTSGKFTDATYRSYVELCADICKRHGLDPLNKGLIRHYDVTQKVCPKWFVEHPGDWEKFKEDVKAEMQPKVAPQPKEAQWIHDGDRRWYRHADGGYTKNNWEKIDNIWYYFDDNGWMKIGWVLWKDKWYYMDPNPGENIGKMAVGLIQVNGETFFLDGTGAMATEPVVFTPDKRGVLR